ncbi:uridine kinase [Prochlorococcus marinus]|uniref:Uridine kinase n=1 Tax=Prochlorococcus marinus XMU1408 TaxID=2213228 RepID=A0A318R4D6_PROMR|nr:uridine kinase [Prochlorococcus marinus]MBW3041877.1 uridine kinase [Prochlorococcus marinus str. XMU1408]PYE03010.1 uridine kinase [Prochlorococcus marinus XMU1408]
MLYKNDLHEFNNIFPRDISDEFLFSFDEYCLFLQALSINPLTFLSTWSDINRQDIISKYWKENTKIDWKWSLSFPLFSVLEKYIENFTNPIIIGFSGLPGSGKSTLGFWIDQVAKDLSLDINVISLDDYYLPGKEMDIAMQGNPWNVPRGFPGSHSIDLLNQSLDTFSKTGFLKSPVFDKSLREGKGDRSGWCELRPKVLILEGWFVGCEPISNLSEIDYILEDKFNLSLNNVEKQFRISIQESLIRYSHIWTKFDKIWHLKSSNFNNTILWKTQQEQEMIKLKGSGLKDNRLTDFIRMIQASIPQETLSCIKADTRIEINQDRRIEKLFSNKYQF